MGFIDERKEYIIEDMYPKRPWMNYLWNEEYIAIVNQFGFGKGMFSAENNFQHNTIRESDSRIFYLKCDGEIYAVNRNYDKKKFDVFRTIVGIGYSTVISEYKGIQAQFTLMIPHKGKRECWRLVLKNVSNQPKQMELYAFADLDVRLVEHLACTYGNFDKELNGVYFRHKVYNSPTEYHVGHFATNCEVKAYDTAKRRFIGGYGNLQTPDGIKADKLACMDNSFDAETIAALQFEVNLDAGEEKTLYFTVGVEKT